MSLYEKWDELTKQEMTPEQSKTFWEGYFLKEKKVYEELLQNKEFLIETTVGEFAKKYNLEPLFALGFIDGINTSLKEEVVLESLEEDSHFKLDIDKEKLFYNMHVAEAEWLYTLPEWEENLSLEKIEEITKEYKASKTFVKDTSVGRNDPCSCGSGKKFKKCCGK